MQDAFIVRYSCGAGERSPWDRRSQLEEHGAYLAKDSIKEMCAHFQASKPPKNPFRRSDVWFGAAPQIVIQTYQSHITILWVFKDGRVNGQLNTMPIFHLDRGEFGIMQGQPYFLTYHKVFDYWDGNGPWCFIPMVFPNLPMEIQ